MSEEKKYHFVLIGDPNDTKEKKIWYLHPTSKQILYEHWETYVKRFLSEGIQQVTNAIFGYYKQHYTHSFAGLIDTRCRITGEAPIIAALKLENELLNNRINSFNADEPIYFDKGATTFMLRKPYEILGEKWSDKMIFPDDENPTEDDIRIIQWPGGQHYYAKIGSLDVVDEDGNQKWDNRDEALIAAQRFIRQLNNNE